ncbi:MAG: MlaE family lipid ABC transporter permease subunit [Gammaproteobacteria bacterium]
MPFQIEEINAQAVKLKFSGRLDVDSISEIWDPCLAVIAKRRPENLEINVKEVNYCDSAGVALLQALHEFQARERHSFIIKGSRSDLDAALVVKESLLTTKKVASKESSVDILLEKFGTSAVSVAQDLRENIVFLGSLAYQIYFVCLNPHKFRWRDFWRSMEDVGPRALPIIALIGFLIGLISTFQAAPSFGQFGAQILMINLVGLGLVREMGPLLTAVLLAGRTASAFAAEIGTMKINQEVNALLTMGLNPVRFLVTPRILATMLITPLLEAFLIFFGLVGCYAVMHSLGYSLDAFLNQIYQSVKPLDYLGGLIKTFIFGWVIAGIGCLHGLKTTFDAQSVGRSTTQAVVSSLIMLVLVDGIFAVLYYVLGI